MVDQYYRKIESVENDIENAMQISSILLKLKGYDNKLSDLSKIGTNKSNISSNLSKIGNNESNISSNLGKIGDNDDDIDEIKSNLNNIKNSLSDFKINYLIQNLFIYNIDLVKEILLDKNNKSFKIFSYDVDDFKLNSYLEINSKILYDYTSDDHIGRLNHMYKFYDIKNTLFKEIKFLKTNAGDNLYDNLSQNDLFYVKIPDNYSIIKIELFLELLHIPNNAIKINIINPLKSNFICIKHYKIINTLSIDNNLTDLESNILSNSGKINDNSSDISTNLVKINSNEDDILYNLNEINYIRNNKSTQYLKNIYNILIYDKKTQIDFRKDIFYEKVFDVNASVNDFIEMIFKIDLEYEDISERNYIKTIYELFDKNSNSLYIKSVNNNEYMYFSNRTIVDENIFYNFTKNIKKIKFVIKFQNLSSYRIIKMWYIINDNYRLVIKNYGL